MTCDGCPAHQVRVGEVQGGVEQEVRLDNPPRSLADVVEQPSAPQGYSALVAVLQDRTNRMRDQGYFINASHFSAERPVLLNCDDYAVGVYGWCTCKVLSTVAPSNFSLGVCGDILPLYPSPAMVTAWESRQRARIKLPAQAHTVQVI